VLALVLATALPAAAAKPRRCSAGRSQRRCASTSRSRAARHRKRKKKTHRVRHRQVRDAQQRSRRLTAHAESLQTPAASLGSEAFEFDAEGPRTGHGWEGFGGLSLPGADWRPYASSSPFNTTTEGAVVDPNSAAMVKTILSWGDPAPIAGGVAETDEDWGHPVYFAEPGDPVYTLKATEPWGENPLNGMQIEIPPYAKPAGGGDAHMTVIEPDGWEYDFWHTQTPTPGGGTLEFGWGGRMMINGNGLETGGTASGFGSLAGVIRPVEFAAGHINHALFIVLKCTSSNTSFGYGEKTHAGTSSYVYPAADGGQPCPADETNAPPMGAHIMLEMSNAQIQALPIPPWRKTVLTALAEYGGYVGDTGGAGFGFQIESSGSYTALGLGDPLVKYAQHVGLPAWQGRYVFEMAGGVEWEKYLRVLLPPSS
jgi:hypothetical protein